MSIYTSACLDIDQSINSYIERRMGFVGEEDPVLHIRCLTLFEITSYKEPEDPSDPNNTNEITKRAIYFNESEIEYSYWYSKYGVSFDKKTKGFKAYGKYLPEVQNEYDHETNGNHYALFNEADSFDECFDHCMNQCSFADLPFFVNVVEDMFKWAITTTDVNKEQ